MAQLESSAYEYHTDGMIFTPADALVGGEGQRRGRAQDQNHLAALVQMEAHGGQHH